MGALKAPLQQMRIYVSIAPNHLHPFIITGVPIFRLKYNVVLNPFLELV